MPSPAHHFCRFCCAEHPASPPHAIPIDENRADFKPVEWKPTASKAGRDAEKNHHFEQVHFPGVHADVGGGYNDNESRLSDIALKWTLAAGSLVPNGLKHYESRLQLHPDPAGIQHDEQKGRPSV